MLKAKILVILILLIRSPLLNASDTDDCQSISGHWVGSMSMRIDENFCQWKVNANIIKTNDKIQFNLYYSDPRSNNDGCFKLHPETTVYGQCFNGSLITDDLFGFHGAIEGNQIYLIRGFYSKLILTKQD